MLELVQKFIKVALSNLYASEKKKKPKEKLNPNYNNRVAPVGLQLSDTEITREILNAQRRALIVEAIKDLVSLSSKRLNEKVKPLIAHTCI